ncbi:DUF2945 domain-containing protein [Novosphingobium profundi]|uniref:DUF2945 domain-containing protein n=1 Tax=Novosphingobium profundi TaxID=1774954 RepID=UPI001BD91AFA|nr:DUF2945 domain-containing protein [Novosphingobium profundi]
MTHSWRKGTRVRWNWGDGTATGTISERFEQRVARKLKGARIVRNATQENPAYLIEQEDGAQVLKSASELERA